MSIFPKHVFYIPVSKIFIDTGAPHDYMGKPVTGMEFIEKDGQHYLKLSLGFAFDEIPAAMNQGLLRPQDELLHHADR